MTVVVIILVVGGVAFAGYLLVAVRGNVAATRSLEDAGNATRPVDLQAFRNLIDPAEEEFLRVNLGAEVFRRVERERLRATLEYVQKAAWNAGVLLRLGEAMRNDPAVAAIGDDLAATALRLRINALLAIAILRVRILMPGLHISVQQLASGYEQLRDQFARAARVQRPTEVSHLLTAL